MSTQKQFKEIERQTRQEIGVNTDLNAKNEKLKQTTAEKKSQLNEAKQPKQKQEPDEKKNPESGSSS